ncbi:nuclear transport factor 2 family protein [Microbacterium candidum]|uniref:Nuclear transport factor 2 family protein n=1 Tax=Microbacterium candidum TaxID=3041922 RepID=A0ABT7MY28_9MICO|nr:nuclear transport factor 2 family protein [Microbacterium sp. ASV49]MDL9979335.1 nuclear transport factor 2 family protein [Microbacterium sp. ASV49]
MTDLEQRLQRAEDRLAILDIEGAYARTWDTVDAEGWAGLFAADGVFEMPATAVRPGARYEGRAELAQFCRDINRRFRGLHLIHLPEIVLDGDRATGRMHFRFESGRTSEDGFEISAVTGMYVVDYVRTATGWRIAHRVERAANRSSTAFHSPVF